MSKAYKLYDIRVTIRQAEANAIVFGSSASVYDEACVNCTLADAVKKRNEMSAAESRRHVAYLTMKYRDDTKPRGFDEAAKPVFGGQS